MDAPEIDFDNTENAYRYRSTPELMESYLFFRSIGRPSLVKLGSNLTKWALEARLPIKPVIRGTIYKQFCAGENLQDCRPLVTRLGEQNVKTILDYSVEAQPDEASFDRAADEFARGLTMAAKESHIPFGVFKPSAIGPSAVLEQVSANHSLSDRDNETWERFCGRFDRLASLARDSKVPLLVDAEESWIQPAIDKVTMELSARYNQKQAILYNTYQMYRWDRLTYLQQCLATAKEQGFLLGVKLVRGAYMEKERRHAQQKGLKSPIHESKADSDRDFDAAVDLALGSLDHCGLFVATHNQSSHQRAIEKMRQLNLSPDNPRVYFSQLYGMSDTISFNMASAGYQVAKYIPYGPIDTMMPYLFRRAQENTSVQGQASRELTMIRRELRRRSDKRS